jgi:hypothetical protein
LKNRNKDVNINIFITSVLHAPKLTDLELSTYFTNESNNHLISNILIKEFSSIILSELEF